MFCLISSCYTVDNAIELASDIFTEVSKKFPQQDLKVCEYCTIVPFDLLIKWKGCTVCNPKKRESLIAQQHWLSEDVESKPSDLRYQSQWSYFEGVTWEVLLILSDNSWDLLFFFFSRRYQKKVFLIVASTIIWILTPERYNEHSTHSTAFSALVWLLLYVLLITRISCFFSLSVHVF